MGLVFHLHQVMGWAYARGEHITKEYIIVYWLAPFGATILAVCVFRLVVSLQEKNDTAQPQKGPHRARPPKEEINAKSKDE